MFKEAAVLDGSARRQSYTNSYIHIAIRKKLSSLSIVQIEFKDRTETVVRARYCIVI